MTAIAVHLLFAGDILLRAFTGSSTELPVEHGVLVVRHGGPTEPSPATPPGKPIQQIPDASRAEAIEALNQLSDLGLVTVRAISTDRRPPWTYKPKTFHGYHPKPQWGYHGRAGWRYDETSGWRYRREPDWAQRAGAVNQLLTQLPTAGETWYVTRWR